jgi:hypothetical protein
MSKEKIMKWFSDNNQDLRQSEYCKKAEELSVLLDEYRKDIVPTLTVGDFRFVGDPEATVNGLRLMAEIIEQGIKDKKVKTI